MRKNIFLANRIFIGHLVVLLILFLTILFGITSSVFASDYRVSGAGLNQPVPRFNASMSLDVTTSSLVTSWLKYYYSRLRLSLISTSITGLSVEGDTATITGEGEVNGNPDYTFTATIIDGSPDAMGIEIYDSGGSLYYQEPSGGGTRALERGNFMIEVSPTATTDPATNVNGNSATLNATVNPNGSETTIYFEWGTSTSYGNSTPSQSIGSGTSNVSVSDNLTGLLRSTTYYHRVVATNVAGTSYGSGESFTTPPITLTIISPLVGDTINRPDIMVKGTVVNSTGNETGVTVNGIVATVYNGEFFVNHVPLQDGQNTITVSATDTSGNTAKVVITVNAVTTIPHVTLNANIESGISPLTTYFSVSTSIPNAVAGYDFDYEGDGTIDYAGAIFANVSFTYTVEGIYYPTIVVTDDQGIQYTDTIAIVVLNTAELDALLRAKWYAMRSSLSNRDTATALTYISSITRVSYEEMFNALVDQLPSIVATQTEFNLISIKENMAKYELVTLENGETYSYEVIFIKDENGLWRIMEF